MTALPIGRVRSPPFLRARARDFQPALGQRSDLVVGDQFQFIALSWLVIR
jgi:hypothetical protein